MIGARDDPEARPDPDAFFEEMRALGRVVSFRWPSDSEQILEWVTGSARGSARGSPTAPPPRQIETRSIGIDFDLSNAGPG